QSDDVLVYQEHDSGWFTHIYRSASGRFCIIAGGDHETSECWLIDLADPDGEPSRVAARETGIRYSLEDRGDELFILTNAGDAIDYKIVVAPLHDSARTNWRDLVPHRSGVYIINLGLFQNYLVRMERANALPSIIVRDLQTGAEHAIAFTEAA